MKYKTIAVATMGLIAASCSPMQDDAPLSRGRFGAVINEDTCVETWTVPRDGPYAKAGEQRTLIYDLSASSGIYRATFEPYPGVSRRPVTRIRDDGRKVEIIPSVRYSHRVSGIVDFVSGSSQFDTVGDSSYRHIVNEVNQRKARGDASISCSTLINNLVERR